MKKYLLIFSLLFGTLSYGQSDRPCQGAGAPDISVGSSCSYTTGTIDGGDSYQSNAGSFGAVTCGLSGADVWYSFVAPASGSVSLNTAAGTITDGVMALYESDCSGSAAVLDCDDDGGTGTMPAINASGLTPGLTYYIRFWDYGGGTGTFDICVIEQAGPAPGGPNQDCVNATGICGNGSFSGNSAGAGSSSEIDISNSGCLSVEHQSSWYVFTALTNGTIGMQIAPTNGTDDYDFGVWGPNPGCPPSAIPTRCSYAAGGGATGMSNGAGDFTESALGDKMVEDLNVIAGETYILLVDNFSATTSPFDLNWSGSASLDCDAVGLPIELLDFKVLPLGVKNVISWETAVEINNDFFSLSHSTDGVDFFEIHREYGAGNSTELNSYSFDHFNFAPSLNYYRLSQTDFNGNLRILKHFSLDNSTQNPAKLIKVVDFMGKEVDESYKGMRILIFDDGTKMKKIGE